MARSADRGTKRTCQNNSCGARFYDLARDPIVCPICGSAFQLAAPVAAAAPTPVDRVRAPAKKPEFSGPPLPDDVPEVESEDVLADVEGAEEPIAAGEEETFLEEEEEGSDVSGIIGGGPAGEGDEEV